MLVNLPSDGIFASMLERILYTKIRSQLEKSAAVAILGPRQVGKTTLSQKITEEVKSIYIDLEDPRDIQKLGDPSFYFDQYNDRLIIIDEVQRRPDLFPILRSQIDRNRRKGHKVSQFLLLSSASNDLLNRSSESLAGRVSYQELFVLNLLEVGNDSVGELWLRGGFPEAYVDADLSWRQDFIRTYLERDIPALGMRIPAETLQRFWTMLAHNQGQLFNAAQIAGSLGISGQSAARYLDLMVDLMLVRRLRPWHTNTKKRLVKSPKTYIRDSGIMHTLLNISTYDGLLGHPASGNSWEGFVIENILSICPRHVDAYFYRTATGVEIDLLLSHGDELMAIEIKRSTAPTLSKGFHVACEDIKPTSKWVVHLGDDEYKLPDNITVLPLESMMKAVIKTFI
ncbi:MAG: putative AAA+ superfamily ATPase [Parasphingorhabdus sp.]|jgi:predicted AAA+ superfamily ATPase